MTDPYFRPPSAAGALAIMLSAAHVSGDEREAFRPAGRTLPRLAEALCAFRAADQSQDLQERLQLQRRLADALIAAAVVLMPDASAYAEDARLAVAAIRIGLAGDTPSLELGQAILDSVLTGEPSPAITRGALLGPGMASLFDVMVSNVRALRDAAQAGETNKALATQAELLNDAQLLELMYRHVPTDTGRRVRAALDDLRVGLAGDSQLLDAASSAFANLMHEQAPLR